jgi:hypothetical protein
MRLVLCGLFLTLCTAFAAIEPPSPTVQRAYAQEQAAPTKVPLVTDFADKLKAAQDVYEAIGQTPISAKATIPAVVPPGAPSSAAEAKELYGDGEADGEITIELIGPTDPVLPGEGFQVYYTVSPANAKATWKNSYPEKAGKAQLGIDEEGVRSLGFFRSVEGAYVFKLYAQVQKDGDFDPFDVAELVVPVGKDTRPKPVPVVPTPDVPVTPVVVVPAPSAELQALVAPLQPIVKAATPANAATLASIWADYANVLKTGLAPDTVGGFEATLVAFMDAATRRANMVQAFPGWSDAFDPMLDKHFGSQDGTLDKAKAVAFVEALAWVCSQ